MILHQTELEMLTDLIPFRLYPGFLLRGEAIYIRQSSQAQQYLASHCLELKREGERGLGVTLLAQMTMGYCS